MNSVKTAILTVIFICQASFSVEFVNYFNVESINLVTCIAIHSDTIWLGTAGGGVLKRDIYGNLLATYSTADGLKSNFINSIAIDNEGIKWFGTGGNVGTDDGVSKFDGTTWTTYDTSDGLIRNVVYEIAIDSDGNKWFGTLC